MSASIVVRKLSFWAFVAFLVAYVGILSMAMFVFQFGLGELPCPLCILQRMGMMLASLGALYVVVRALRGELLLRELATGLGLAILGAVVGAAISIRQILLHILPGDPGYGEAVLGLHLYTWALITFVVVIVFACVVAATDASPTEAELIEFCKRQLASFKKPKRVEIVDQLPKNAYGKVLRRELIAGGDGLLQSCFFLLKPLDF